MNIASLVLGIIALLLSFIPLLGTVAYLPAVLSIIFGLVVIFKKAKEGEQSKKGMGIVGLVLSIIAIVLVNSMNSAIVETIDELTSDNVTISDNASSNSNSSTTEQTQTTCSVGQTIQNKDLKVTFVSFNENFTGYSRYATINSGCKVIKAEFEFENISGSDQLASAYDFDCYADGYSCDQFWSTDDSGFSHTLSNGKKAKGTVYFQVPKDATSITLEYETNVWTDSKLVFVAK